MQNIPLLAFLAEAFQCHMHHYQCLPIADLPRPPNIDNGAHGTENLQLKSQVSEDFACEIYLIIYATLLL